LNSLIVDQGQKKFLPFGKGEAEATSLQKRTGWALKKTLLTGCSKTLRYKAPEIPACGRQAEE